ncbi:hypothetical protein HDU91_005876, partial [Kappamyces sp. JEL0680]
LNPNNGATSAYDDLAALLEPGSGGTMPAFNQNMGSQNMGSQSFPSPQLNLQYQMFGQPTMMFQQQRMTQGMQGVSGNAFANPAMYQQQMRAGINQPSARPPVAVAPRPAMTASGLDPTLAAILSSLPPQKQTFFQELVAQFQRGMMSVDDFNARTRQLVNPNFQPQMAAGSNSQQLKKPIAPTQSRKPPGQELPSTQGATPNLSNTLGKRDTSTNSSSDPTPAKKLKQSTTEKDTADKERNLPRTAAAAKLPAGSSGRKQPDQPLVSTQSSVEAPASQDVELDIDEMQDVTNYAGISIREEESNLNEMTMAAIAAYDSQYSEIPFLDPDQLESMVLDICAPRGIEEIDESYTSFVSQATELYVTQLLESMCAASDHRSSVDYNVFKSQSGTGTSQKIELVVEEKDDVLAILGEIDMRERQEQNALLVSVGPRPIEELDEHGNPIPQPAIEAATTASSSQTIASAKSSSTVVDPATGKKKRAPAGPKKDLPEAVKQKNANSAAMMAVGSTQKAWMLPGASALTLPAAKRSESRSNSAGAAANTFSPSTGSELGSVTVRAGNRPNRITQKRITIKDALGVMETFRHLKSSELLYKWWANVK